MIFFKYRKIRGTPLILIKDGEIHPQTQKPLSSSFLWILIGDLLYKFLQIEKNKGYPFVFNWRDKGRLIPQTQKLFSSQILWILIGNLLYKYPQIEKNKEYPFNFNRMDGKTLLFSIFMNFNMGFAI